MYKLLIVEDEKELREGLALYFPWEELGFVCIGAASDGDEALAILKEEKVDVVITDISMPKCSGIDLARSIREVDSVVQLIYLTAYRDFDFAMSAMEYNVSNYLVKPADYDQITEVFSKIKLELDSKNPEEPTHGESYNQRIINAVKEYVSEGYRTATLEQAAKIVHMHPYYLSRFFKKNTGINFSDFLMEIRMKRAGVLIMDFRYKLYEVSEVVGYANTKNFTRAFRKYYDMSPREYRNKKAKSTL